MDLTLVCVCSLSHGVRWISMTIYGHCDVNWVTWPVCAILIGRENFCCALIGRDLKGPYWLLWCNIFYLDIILLPWCNIFYLDIFLLPWWNIFYLDIFLLSWCNIFCHLFTAVMQHFLPWYHFSTFQELNDNIFRWGGDIRNKRNLYVLHGGLGHGWVGYSQERERVLAVSNRSVACFP